MVAVEEQLYTVDEYFDFCEVHEGLYEYVNGEIIEMAGETPIANLIAGNIHYFFRTVLKGRPFLMFQNAVKLMLGKGKIYRIPDMMVIHKEGVEAKSVKQPALIVEVLSESSMDTDRRKKLAEYCAIDSLQYYLIVSQDMSLIEMYRRVDKKWEFEFYTNLSDNISLSFFETILPLNDVYENVEFE
jgi:Uma2 family endonuclease